MEESSSSEEPASSTEAACSDAPSERDWLEAPIWLPLRPITAFPNFSEVSLSSASLKAAEQ
ncbi:MAG: hypothetical protein BWK80_43065 [Desulfobacteraceae bacterium IS3]|nr:MAG: hypothetical protein BWK80_43065 [Desulfobacteraceae bacterium IS3]